MKENENKKLLQAAALKYNISTNQAPVLVGLGKGYVAQKMVERAQKHDVPVVEDVKLSNVLQTLSLGDEIPRELYEVIAEILVFISGMDEEQGKRFGLDTMSHK